MSSSQPNMGYGHILKFLEKYTPQGFEHIGLTDATVIALEHELKAKGQYLQISDCIRMNVLYASSTCRDLFGLEPSEIHMSTFFERTDPADQERHSRARSRTLKAAQDLYMKRQGVLLHASDFRQPNAQGIASPTLFQAYMFYCEHPRSTVYMALVLTDLTSIEGNGHGHHYYLGSDTSMFRYPDKALLAIGVHFTEREFEILEFLSTGMDSEAIAKKLFLSANTVNTHRRNIVRKSGRSSTHDVVMSLKEVGIL